MNNIYRDYFDDSIDFNDLMNTDNTNYNPTNNIKTNEFYNIFEIGNITNINSNYGIFYNSFI